MNNSYIGIIGWNEYTKLIINVLLTDVKNIEILALATSSEEGIHFAKNQAKIKHVFTKPHLLFEFHQLDFVFIFSDAETHLEYVQKSLNNNLDIIICPPLASNVEDGNAIQQLARKHPNQKVVLWLDHRLNHNLISIKKHIDNHNIGSISSIEIKSTEPFDRDNTTALGNISKGIYMDITLQSIDIVHWLTGSHISKVYAIGNSQNSPSNRSKNDADSTVIIGKTLDGVLVNFTSNRSYVQSRGFQLTIEGSIARIEYQSRSLPIVVNHSMTQNTIYQPIEKVHIKSLVEELIIARRTSDRMISYLQEGTRAVQIAVAMTKSFLLDEIVTIEHE